MKVSEALKIIQAAPQEAVPFQVILACDFTPLHLQTFFNAHLQVALPERRVIVSTGLYDNLSGTVERAAERPAQCVAVIIEWADLDPRLGFRGSGLWGPGSLPDILSSSRMALQCLAARIECLPTAAYVSTQSRNVRFSAI
jgi:hypothetical protein